MRWQRKDFCAVFLPYNRTHHLLGHLVYLWEPLSAQQLSHGEATGHSKCVWLLCASRVTTPQWLGSELPQWWSATLCGVAVETWGGKKGDNKMVLNSEHPELTKNQKQ